MTDTLQEQLIVDLEHRRFGAGSVGPDAPTMTSLACGDTVSVEAHVIDGVVRSVTWDGRGCTVSMASAGALAELATGLPAAKFGPLLERFVELVNGPVPTGDLEAESAAEPELRDAVAFAGIGRFPLRARCATLAWRAMARSLGQAAA